MVMEYTNENAQKQVNDLYDAYEQSQMTGMEEAYNTGLESYEQARQNTTQAYEQANEDIQNQYDIQRRELDMQANANYVNTGIGSQTYLRTNSARMGALGANDDSYQDAMKTVDRAVETLNKQYQSEVKVAIAENNFNRAQALYAEWENGYTRDQTKAKTLANYGDFSGFLKLGYSEDQCVKMREYWDYVKAQDEYSKALTKAQTLAQYGVFDGYLDCGYTQEQVNAMRQYFISSNPAIAYQLGLITKEEYELLVAKNDTISDYIQSKYGGYGYGGGTTTTTNAVKATTLGQLLEFAEQGIDSYYDPNFDGVGVTYSCTGGIVTKHEEGNEDVVLYANGEAQANSKENPYNDGNGWG